MDRRGLWVLLNVVNVFATGGVSLLWWWRARAAAERLRGAVPLASNRRQLARNRDYGRGQAAISGGLCLLGAVLIGVALSWAGPVPLFVVASTGAFALLWVTYAALALLDWRWLSEVARLRDDERQGGC